MIKYTPADYTVPGFVDRLITQGLDRGRCLVDVADETDVEMPVRVFMLNVIFWEPMMTFGVIPTFNEITNIKSLTNSSISIIHTKLYDVVLDKRPDVYYMDIVRAFVDNIDRLYRFICVHMGSYMPSLDMLGLAKLLDTPGIKELTTEDMDPRNGPRAAEKRLKYLGDALLQRLRDPNQPNNCLYPYMRADTLKSNQIPQALIAFGTRAELDDTMRRHIINASAISGLRSPADYATEYLSAKKAIYFSRDGIRSTQYFGRKLRLACAMQQHIHPGACGPTRPIQYIIPQERYKNYLHKMIIEDGRRVVLTHENIGRYVDHPVNLISPLSCRHRDGICEYCAGYGKDRLRMYMPPDIHIGMLSETWVACDVSQQVLSTKHLLQADSKEYALPQSAAKYFYKDETSLFWHHELAEHLHNYSIRITLDSLGLLTDLSLFNIPVADTFSRLPYIELIKDDEVVDVISLEADVFVPYLSESTLEYMHSIFNQLQVDDTYVTIPLSGLDPKQEFMKFIIMNDGMLAYTKRVSNFLGKTISEYTTCSDLLRAATSIIQSRASVNTFYIEVMLKSFLITSEDDYLAPFEIDPLNIKTGTIESVINERTISGKLAFERLQQFLNLPHVSTKARPIGLFAPYFGL